MESTYDNNNSEMEKEFDNCADGKVCLYETVISGGFINKELYDTDNKQSSVHNNVTIKAENIDDEKVVDDMVCLNESAITKGFIKHEPCLIKDEQGNIQNYLDVNLDNLIVVGQETQLVTDCIDTKVCVYETIISGGHIKEETCDTGYESGSIHNNVDMKACSECGEKYDLYCLKCPMLTRIFDSNDLDSTDIVMRTLPKNFIDICKTQSGIGTVALRAIPKGVVFGPFKGLDSTKAEAISKWKLKNNKLDITKDVEGLNWMKHIRRTDKNCHQNLVPFQYEDGLYYRSACHLNVGDELLVHWDRDSKESKINDMEDTYWEPPVCECLGDSYACTFCCVGYKSISHLKAHNTTCIEKRNREDFCKEIVQCDICKIYLDKKEYLDYHMDRCSKSNKKFVFNSRHEATRKSDLTIHTAIHNADRPFACIFCSYKTKYKASLERHIAVHNDDKSFACTICPYKTRKKSILEQHIAVHNDDRLLACTLCLYITTSKSHLKRHIAIHNDDKRFMCTLCPYSATKKWILKQHIAIHKGDKSFACTLCPYKTAKKRNLTQHIAIHNDDKPFTCTLCPYKATTKLLLKQHIGIHNGDKRFACTLCAYKTRRRSNLRLHMSFHNDDKPFACTVCSYKTKHKPYLKKHIANHNDKYDKPFACTLCPYKTARKSILEQHIAVHNDDRSLMCTFCPYITTIKSNLKRHIVVHNGDKPFACAICPYKTKTKSYLKKHIANHYGDKPKNL